MKRKTETWWAQVLQNRLIALVLAMVVIVPLIATPADGRIHGVAAFAFEGLAILLFGTLILRSKWDLRREKIVAFLKTGPNLPILALGVLGGISVLYAAHKGYAEQALLQLVAGILIYFVAAYQFRRSEHLTKLVDTVMAVGAVAAIYGFVQYGLSSTHSVVGPFGNDQLMGSFLMILLPLLGITALTEKSPARKNVAMVVTVMVGACLALAHSRSAWLGLTAGAAVIGVLAIVLARRGTQLFGRKADVVLPIAMVISAIALFLFLAPNSGSILDRVASIGNANGQSTFIQRETQWAGSLKMVANKPILGYGIGQYPPDQAAFTHVGVTTAGAKLMGSNAVLLPSLLEQAHDYYLQLTAELGLTGLLLMLAVLGSFLTLGLMKVRSMDAGVRRNVLLASIAAIVAFMVDAMASPSWQFGQISMFMWLMLGVGVSCARGHQRRDREEAEVAASPRLSRATALVGAGLMATMLPSVVFANIGNRYVPPVSATLGASPDPDPGGTQIQLQAIVRFNDGSTVDFTNDPSTATFSATRVRGTGPVGQLGGPNNSVYSPAAGENDEILFKVNLSVLVTSRQTGGGTIHMLQASRAVAVGNFVVTGSSSNTGAAIAGGIGGAALLYEVFAAHGGPAAGGGTGKNVLIRPGNASVTEGQSQAFTLWARVNGDKLVDVTLSKYTRFTVEGGHGYLTGPNDSVYQSVAGEPESVTVTGEYSGPEVQGSDTSSLKVTEAIPGPAGTNAGDP
ncbi:MAG: O-antigen ligase family protein [Armatimonadetes bacterium]|nr:O-antigen ligase family protein [Armatimonadota bacterium]MDE2206601.1 O-antigen ligase family protein [Armatimonadota bacterium]